MKYIYLFLIFVLTACSSTTLQKTSDIVTADEIITSGQAEALINKAELSRDEKLIITHARNRYEAFREKWKDAIFDLDVRDDMFDEFQADFNGVVNEYKKVDTVVIDKWSQYNNEDQEELREYGKLSQNLANVVDSLVKVGERHLAISNAIKLAIVGMSVIKKIEF